MANEMKYCRNCGEKIKQGAKFCTNCGYQFVTEPQQAAPKMMYCQNCGRELAASVKFCKYCGKPVDSVSEPQKEYSREVRQKPAPAGKKRLGVIFILAAMILIFFYMVGTLSGPVSSGQNKGDQTALINRVEVTLPNPTGPEALVSLQTNVAMQYYIEARMYLEKLSTYNVNEADPEALRRLVDDTVTAFENADKSSESLGRSVDLWMETDDRRGQPEIKVLQTASADKGTILSKLFLVTAYAKDKSPSEMTAQEIVDAYDKAKNGQKLKSLAELMGTDARHAYAQLKIAQATLEGADAAKMAEQATNCIKVAKTLKTAGTVAGLVIAAAPMATGAVATMATGEMLATGGGIIMGTINSGLELTSTGATLYYGTDENMLTEVADKAADSKAMKAANLVVGLAGVGYNIKNQLNDMDKLIGHPDKLAEYEKLMSNLSTNDGKEASNLFGILSFALGSVDPGEGTVLGIKTKSSPEGLKVDIEDTKVGTSPEQQEAMKQVLKDTGYSEEKAAEAVNHGVSLMESGKQPEEAVSDPAADLPEDFVEKKLKENEAIAPGSTFIDLDDFIDSLTTFMESLRDFKPAEETEQPEETDSPETQEETEWWEKDEVIKEYDESEVAEWMKNETDDDPDAWWNVHGGYGGSGEESGKYEETKPAPASEVKKPAGETFDGKNNGLELKVTRNGVTARIKIDGAIAYAEEKNGTINCQAKRDAVLKITVTESDGSGWNLMSIGAEIDPFYSDIPSGTTTRVDMRKCSPEYDLYLIEIYGGAFEGTLLKDRYALLSVYAVDEYTETNLGIYEPDWSETK